MKPQSLQLFLIFSFATKSHTYMYDNYNLLKEVSNEYYFILAYMPEKLFLQVHNKQLAIRHISSIKQLWPFASYLLNNALSFHIYNFMYCLYTVCMFKCTFMYWKNVKLNFSTWNEI